MNHAWHTYPVTASLIARGDAFVDSDGSLVGIASDGTHVSLQRTDPAVTLAYLAEFPTPDMW